MRINDLLTENQNLEEGPLLNKIGSGIGKAVGTAGKAAGSVAGGIAGLGSAFKKGYTAGKDIVGQGGDAEADIISQKPGTDAGTAPTAQQINKAGPAGTAPAKAQTGMAAQAMKKTTAAIDQQEPAQASQSMYAQVKANVDKLDKKGKQRIMQLLQKSLAAPQQAPAQKPAAPAAAPAQQAAPQQAAAPAAQAAPAQQPAGRAQGGGKVAGQQSQTPGAIKKRQQRAAKKGTAGEKTAAPGASQAEIDADRERIMGNFTDSIDRKYPSLAESLARKVEEQKRQLFSEELQSGKTSIYKK